MQSSPAPQQQLPSEVVARQRGSEADSGGNFHFLSILFPHAKKRSGVNKDDEIHYLALMRDSVGPLHGPNVIIKCNDARISTPKLQIDLLAPDEHRCQFVNSFTYGIHPRSDFHLL